MTVQSEPVIEELRKRLKDSLSKDVSFPSETDVEEFFETFRKCGRSTSSTKKASRDSFWPKKNWSVVAPSVTGVAAGATGLVVSVTVFDLIFSGCSQTTDGINMDAAAINKGVRGKMSKIVDAFTETQTKAVTTAVKEVFKIVEEDENILTETDTDESEIIE